MRWGRGDDVEQKGHRSVLNPGPLLWGHNHHLSNRAICSNVFRSGVRALLRSHFEHFKMSLQLLQLLRSFLCVAILFSGPRNFASISVEEEKMTECSKFRLNCAHKNSLFVGFVPQWTEITSISADRLIRDRSICRREDEFMQQISGRDALSAIVHIFYFAEVLLLIAAPWAECRNGLMGPICIRGEEKGAASLPTSSR